MKSAPRKIIYSCSLLLILVTAIIGQKVHIYTEDPLHFAAFCRNAVSDNGGDCQVVEKCVVDNFCFYPCVCVEAPIIEVRFELLGHKMDATTRSKQTSDLPLVGLRAPPVGI